MSQRHSACEPSQRFCCQAEHGAFQWLASRWCFPSTRRGWVGVAWCFGILRVLRKEQVTYGHFFSSSSISLFKPNLGRTISAKFFQLWSVLYEINGSITARYRGLASRDHPTQSKQAKLGRTPLVSRLSHHFLLPYDSMPLGLKLLKLCHTSQVASLPANSSCKIDSYC